MSEGVKKIIDELNNLEYIDDSLINAILYEINRHKSSSLFSKTKHKTIILKYHNKYDVEIDEEISELIELLWKNNINTNNSCQNNVPGNYIWIEFDTLSDYDIFLQVVTNKIDKEMFDKIFFNYDINHRIGSWIHKLDIQTINGEEEEYDYFSYSVRFPKSDYNFVLDKFKNLK
jgi:hypothetical protein